MVGAAVAGRVLVVDAEERARSLVIRCLEGFNVLSAASGEEARIHLRLGGFGLVISELQWPGENGLEWVQWLRESQPGVEFVILTAHGTVETAVQAMKLGALDYLRKPLQAPASLRLLATRVLEGGLRHRRPEGRGGRTDLPALSHGDPAMRPVLDALRKVARTDATVMLLGESGTGKEVTARTLHRMSARASGPFVAINCASLSEQLLESELFGHERGAFTGATSRKQGRMELAHGGTFFLDELGELKPELQARLLRVLEGHAFERVGGTRSLEVDIRWIAATHRDLRGLIAEGRFREDLYHRVSVFPVRLPALRERPADILPLAEVLLADAARRLQRPGLTLSEEARRRLMAAPWPGNIRELANVLERAAILTEDGLIEAMHLSVEPPLEMQPAPLGRWTLAQLEQQAIEQALKEVGGNRRQAAERLGIGLRTLYQKLRAAPFKSGVSGRGGVPDVAGSKTTRRPGKP